MLAAGSHITTFKVAMPKRLHVETRIVPLEIPLANGTGEFSMGGMARIYSVLGLLSRALPRVVYSIPTQPSDVSTMTTPG